ncbi:MAG: hypothetical protein LiPW16_355, partial [Microgenomates group bacterium LiPW_16]
EGLFAKKEVTLPHSVSKYISRLKAEGRLDEAKLVAQQVRERKEQTREKKATEELDRTIFKLLKTDNPQELEELEIRSIWLLEAAGVILPAERGQELVEILDSKAPELQAVLENQLAKIRDEVKRLMPLDEAPQIRKYRH